MKTQTMLMGGPHNGALFTYHHDGASPPIDLFIGVAPGVNFDGKKVDADRYRLIGHDRLVLMSQASYEYVGKERKRSSLIDLWL